MKQTRSYLRELIENPREIRIGFAQAPASGKVGLRRRYVRVIDIGRGRSVFAVTEIRDGQLTAVTFFSTKQVPKNPNVRSGLLIYQAAGGEEVSWQGTHPSVCASRRGKGNGQAPTN